MLIFFFDPNEVLFNDLELTELFLLKKSTLFPNPTNGQFILKVSKEQLGGSWSLFNIQGQLVEKGFLNNTKSYITIKSLNTGIYVFQLNWSNKKEVHKLIVR